MSLPQNFHPIAIHLPIALATMMPFIVGICMRLGQAHRMGRRAWVSYLAISGLMLASSGIAYWTGERDAFLSPAEMSALDMHRWSAKWFLGVALLSLCLTAFMLYYPKFMPRFSRFLIFFFALAQLGVAIWAGHLGGRLVFG